MHFSVTLPAWKEVTSLKIALLILFTYLSEHDGLGIKPRTQTSGDSVRFQNNSLRPGKLTNFAKAMAKTLPSARADYSVSTFAMAWSGEHWLSQSDSSLQRWQRGCPWQCWVFCSHPGRNPPWLCGMTLQFGKAHLEFCYILNRGHGRCVKLRLQSHSDR